MDKQRKLDRLLDLHIHVKQALGIMKELDMETLEIYNEGKNVKVIAE